MLAWLKNGWFVVVAYVVGFFVMLALWGWHPGEIRQRSAEAPAVSSALDADAAHVASGSHEPSRASPGALSTRAKGA